MVIISARSHHLSFVIIYQDYATNNFINKHDPLQLSCCIYGYPAESSQPSIKLS